MKKYTKIFKTFEHKRFICDNKNQMKILISIKHDIAMHFTIQNDVALKMTTRDRLIV